MNPETVGANAEDLLREQREEEARNLLESLMAGAMVESAVNQQKTPETAPLAHAHADGSIRAVDSLDKLGGEGSVCPAMKDMSHLEVAAIIRASEPNQTRIAERSIERAKQHAEAVSPASKPTDKPVATREARIVPHPEHTPAIIIEAATRNDIVLEDQAAQRAEIIQRMEPALEAGIQVEQIVASHEPAARKIVPVDRRDAAPLPQQNVNARAESTATKRPFSVGESADLPAPAKSEQHTTIRRITTKAKQVAGKKLVFAGIEDSSSASLSLEAPIPSAKRTDVEQPQTQPDKETIYATFGVEAAVPVVASENPNKEADVTRESLVPATTYASEKIDTFEVTEGYAIGEAAEKDYSAEQAKSRSVNPSAETTQEAALYQVKAEALDEVLPATVQEQIGIIRENPESPLAQKVEALQVTLVNTAIELQGLLLSEASAEKIEAAEATIAELYGELLQTIGIEDREPLRKAFLQIVRSRELVEQIKSELALLDEGLHEQKQLDNTRHRLTQSLAQARQALHDRLGSFAVLIATT